MLGWQAFKYNVMWIDRVRAARGEVPSGMNSGAGGKESSSGPSKGRGILVSPV